MESNLCEYVLYENGDILWQIDMKYINKVFLGLFDTQISRSYSTSWVRTNEHRGSICQHG